MRRRRALVAVAVVAAAALAAGFGGTWALRHTRLGDRLRHGTLRETGWTGIRMARPAPDRHVRLPGDGPALAGDVFEPSGGTGARIAVLLVHGNRGDGSAAPFYRLLARRLADRGAWVLAMNLRGYGASAPAPADRGVRATDLVADVERGRDAVERLAPPGVARGAVGHSLGANLVLLLPPRPGWRVVSIEPGWGLRRRVVDPPAPMLPVFVEKLRRNLRGARHDAESVRALYADLDPEAGGPPVAEGTVLIVQGRRAGSDAVESMRRAAAARPGCRLELLDSADHELGVTGLGSWVLFPPARVDRLADVVARFVATGESGT